jgi:carbon starvation protein
MGKAKYMWVTAVPGIVLACITMYAGYLQITRVYLAAGKENYLLATMACMVLAMIVIVVVACFKRWAELLQIKERVTDIWGERVIMPLPGEAVCLINDPKDGGAAVKGATEKWG